MSLNDFLVRSEATAEFRDALSEFLRTQMPNERITFHLGAPPVKIERVVTKVLESVPDLEIERIEIDGSSGCEYFRGHLTVHAGGEAHEFRFHWDCRWRAVEQGWTDYFGFADQTRAAREFGYDCFRVWEALADAPATDAEYAGEVRS